VFLYSPGDISVFRRKLTLRRVKFQPEYAGKLNFYLNVLDEKIKLPHENPSVGIILSKEKNNTGVEFSIKTINWPIGVSTYKISKDMPEDRDGYKCAIPIKASAIYGSPTLKVLEKRFAQNTIRKIAATRFLKNKVLFALGNGNRKTAYTEGLKSSNVGCTIFRDSKGSH